MSEIEESNKLIRVGVVKIKFTYYVYCNCLLAISFLNNNLNNFRING